MVCFAEVVHVGQSQQNASARLDESEVSMTQNKAAINTQDKSKPLLRKLTKLIHYLAFMLTLIDFVTPLG